MIGENRLSFKSFCAIIQEMEGGTPTQSVTAGGIASTDSLGKVKKIIKRKKRKENEVTE